MSIYDWLLEYREIYVYNYELISKKLVGYSAVFEKLVTDENGNEAVRVVWNYNDNGQIFHYEGLGRIRERNLYVHTTRRDDVEYVLSILPVPHNYRFEILWGIGVGTTGGFPAAFRLLVSSEFITIEEAEQEFLANGIALENSLIVMDYNPASLRRTAKVLKENTKVSGKLIRLKQVAYEEDYLEALNNKLDKDCP